MRDITVLLLLLGFTFSSFAQQTINASITHDGIQRNYIVYIPELYDGTTTVPLVLNFHGYGSNKEDLFSVEQYLPQSQTIISLEAPLKLPFGGFSWFEFSLL